MSPTTGGLPASRNRLGSGSHGADGSAAGGDGSWRKRETDSARGGILGEDHSLEERDEETGPEKDTPNVKPNGSSNDVDMSRSISGRSIASPSFRDESGGRRGPTESLATTLSGLTLHDDGKKPMEFAEASNNATDTHGAPAIQSGISAARPPGLENEPANVSWSYRDPKGNIQGMSSSLSKSKW